MTLQNQSESQVKDFYILYQNRFAITIFDLIVKLFIVYTIYTLYKLYTIYSKMSFVTNKNDIYVI